MKILGHELSEKTRVIYKEIIGDLNNSVKMDLCQ